MANPVKIRPRLQSKVLLFVLALLSISTSCYAVMVYRGNSTQYNYYEKVICEGPYETVTFPSTSQNILVINDDDNTSIYVNLEGGEVTNENFELKALERLKAVNHRVNSITLLAKSGTVEVRVYVTY